VQTVFITGVTSGFGRAAARQFHAKGHRVIGTGRRQERLDELAAELGQRFVGLCFDVTDRAAVDAAVAGVGDIDILVNNAGLALGLEPAWEADIEDWLTMVKVNIEGVLYLTRAVLPGMVARKHGHIVNVSSVAASWPYPGGNVYGASKAFLTQFTLNLRADLVGTRVRMSSIEPGLCETEFSLVRFKGDEAAADKPYADVEAMTADDIARTIVWVTEQPRHVNINRVELMATEQAWGPFAIARGTHDA